MAAASPALLVTCSDGSDHCSFTHHCSATPCFPFHVSGTHNPYICFELLMTWPVFRVLGPGLLNGGVHSVNTHDCLLVSLKKKVVFLAAIVSHEKWMISRCVMLPAGPRPPPICGPFSGCPHPSLSSVFSGVEYLSV